MKLDPMTHPGLPLETGARSELRLYSLFLAFSWRAVLPQEVVGPKSDNLLGVTLGRWPSLPLRSRFFPQGLTREGLEGRGVQPIEIRPWVQMPA